MIRKLLRIEITPAPEGTTLRGVARYTNGDLDTVELDSTTPYPESGNVFKFASKRLGIAVPNWPPKEGPPPTATRPKEL